VLNDEFPFGIVCEVVVSEDGTVVEFCQTVDANLMCLQSKQLLSNHYGGLLDQAVSRIQKFERNSSMENFAGTKFRPLSESLMANTIAEHTKTLHKC